MRDIWRSVTISFNTQHRPVKLWLAVVKVEN